MFHDATIKEGAFIISDAHYSVLHPELLEFIKEIHLKKLRPTQLILMGDIFDALFGYIPFTCKQNQELIDLFNAIAQEIEVIYLEGNHDFNLKQIFPHIRVVPIQEQPLTCKLEDGREVVLAHGDFDGSFGYRFYTRVIRNRYVLFFLKYIDIISKHAILRYVDSHLAKKDDCKELKGFITFIQKRLADTYKYTLFIEGHYHQNKKIKYNDFLYINLAAFACNQRYFIVNSIKENELLKEKVFSKGM